MLECLPEVWHLSFSLFGFLSIMVFKKAFYIALFLFTNLTNFSLRGKLNELSLSENAKNKKTGFSDGLAKSIQEVFPGLETDFSELIDKSKAFDKVRLNVFMHGTYGFETISLSFFKAYHDKDLTGSVHETAVRHVLRGKMRSLYECSLMYNEGLFRINPEKEDSEKKLECLALLPIIRSFSKVSEYSDRKAKPDTTVKDLFYVFGWSGMLGQGARREAGLALYNALSQEKAQIQAYLQLVDSEAKVEVREYAHSHGGNCVLNTAWVDALARNKSAENYYKPFFLGNLGIDIKAKFSQLLKTVAIDSQEAKKRARYEMDKWLYKPTARTGDGCLIDELYLMASPFQQETWPLIFSDTFGHVISYYSDGDNIQNMDVVSTKSRKSVRSLNEATIEKANSLFLAQDGSPKLVQIQVTLPRLEELEQAEAELGTNNFESESTIGNLLYKSSLWTNTKGPSHLEFWFIYWSGLSERLCIRPVPILAFTPLVQEPWKLGQSLNIRFDHSTQGDLLISALDENAKRNKESMSIYPNELYKAVKKEFYSRRHLLEDTRLIENEKVAKVVSFIRKAMLFLATS